MGVTYKLREEVIRFIISQRQSDPLASCRQLAESASQKFDLTLSKSSVHDVLKESGIITPRGRKPKNKFEIPQEKKKQIQASLSQSVILSAAKDLNKINSIRDSSATPQNDIGSEVGPHKSLVILSEALESPVILSHPPSVILKPPVIPAEVPPTDGIPPKAVTGIQNKNDIETSSEYEGAGRIFLKAALWDLGIFSKENIKATDWNYYLTYSKGIKVDLENNKSFFIDLPLPLERCIREAADGLINNVKPLNVHKVSDEGLFKACMDAQAGFKISSISIVDCLDHILLGLNNIVELNRRFVLQNRVFVDSNEKDIRERSKAIFFSQSVILSEGPHAGHSQVAPKDLRTSLDSSASPQNDDQLAGILDNIYNLKGFNTTNKDENVVTLLIDDSYENKAMIQVAAEKLNGMYLYDEQDRLVKVKIQE
jgi:hypothetical protein